MLRSWLARGCCICRYCCLFHYKTRLRWPLFLQLLGIFFRCGSASRVAKELPRHSEYFWHLRGFLRFRHSEYSFLFLRFHATFHWRRFLRPLLFLSLRLCFRMQRTTYG